MLLIDHCNANAITLEQWCSGKFFLVGTLALHYGRKPYRGGGGGRRCLNEWPFIKGKNPCSTMGVIDFEITGRHCNTSRLRCRSRSAYNDVQFYC